MERGWALGTVVTRSAHPFLRRTWALARKDLLVEWRRKESLTAMLFFAGLALVVFSFALGPDAERLRAAAPGLLWLAVVFAGMLGVGRAYQVEMENGCLEALALYPGDREAIYFGKFLSTLLFVLILEWLLVPMMAVLYNLAVGPRIGLVLLVGALGAVGFAAVGGLYAALSVHVRAREVMFPLLLLPVVIPVVVGAVRGTEAAISGAPFGELWPWLIILGAFDAIFVAVCPLLFDVVLEEV